MMMIVPDIPAIFIISIPPPSNLLVVTPNLSFRRNIIGALECPVG